MGHQELDLEAYRRRAERFVEEIDREYLLHLSGRKPELELAPIYARHAELFRRGTVERMRQTAARATGEEGRRLRYLLHFALDGMIGEATRGESEEAARLEASLEVAVDGDAVPYRQVPVRQANEADPARRSELEAVRNDLLDERLNPLLVSALESAQAVCGELGWRSYAAAYAELRDLDLSALAVAATTFVSETEDGYGPIVEPELDRAGLPRFGRLTRSDLPRFFRVPELDAGFPAERLVPSFTSTLAGLGVDLAAQSNIHLDTEPRATKSPRAFCSVPRVPDEVHLVISPVGGREDYSALFHEGGHAEHFAGTASDLAFEFRHLGDNAVTESFAFLCEQLTEDPCWLREILGVEDVEPVIGHARAARLVMVRRYCAKLAYELELHSGEANLAAMPDRYASRVGAAIRVAWPSQTWLADVDSGFYVACYLRAWAVAAVWRRALRERFTERWFASPAAGEWLRGLWRQGQRLGAEELLAETLGEELSFAALRLELSR